MKTQVTVDGVTLTRAQVEAAHKQLNMPDSPPPPPQPLFKPGDVVQVVRQSFGAPMHQKGVVVGGAIADILVKHYDATGSGYVRFTDGVNSWTVSEMSLVKIRTHQL